MLSWIVEKRPFVTNIAAPSRMIQYDECFVSEALRLPDSTTRFHERM